MEEIGVRDLKAGLSEVLRRVGAGETVRVTLRGQAVADIVPVGGRRREEWLEKLIAEGRVTPSTRPLPRDAPPPVQGNQSASALILAERDSER